MKKYICVMISGIILLAAGIVFASLPKVTLKCDGQNCVMYKNHFGQIIRAKYKFGHFDVQRCEVLPVKILTDDGQTDVKTFTLRLMGDKIPYTPEWVKDDPEGLSNICTNIARQKPLKYSDGGFLDWMKNLWAIFFIAGLWLIAAAPKQKNKENK